MFQKTGDLKDPDQFCLAWPKSLFILAGAFCQQLNDIIQMKEKFKKYGLLCYARKALLQIFLLPHRGAIYIIG